MSTVALAAAGSVLAGAPPVAQPTQGPPLGAARSFVVLGGSTVSNTGASIFTGSVGVSPGTSIVGFPPGTATGGLHANDAAASAAHSDAALAYAFLLGMQSPPANDRTGIDLGGKTLTPGVYHFNTSAQITGQLVLDAQGDSNALFVIKVGSTLTTATGASVVVINGGADYDESNVYWQVGTSATLGSATVFTGHILANASITIVIGSSMTGNALALNGAVTTDSNTNSSPAIIGPPIVTPPGTTPPNQLIAAPILAPTCKGADVNWSDTSDDETEFRLYRRDGVGPAFNLIATIPAPDTLGTTVTVTYQDLALDPSTLYTYRVTSFSPATGESAPSNDGLVQTCDLPVVPPVLPPTRWLDVHVGGKRNVVRDSMTPQHDSVITTGSYAVIDVTPASIPGVQHEIDPRVDGIAIQVTGPGGLVLLSIPADAAGWRVMRKGVYRWRSLAGRDSPATIFRINTRLGSFAYKTKRNQFGSAPSSTITVTLTYQGATGSDTKVWNLPSKKPGGTTSVFRLPR